MAADDHRPYRGGTAQAEPPPGHPGQGPPVSPPVRPVNRTWWVLPFAGGALAVIVAAAAVTAVLHTPRMFRQDSAASSAESSSGGGQGPADAVADVPRRPGSPCSPPPRPEPDRYHLRPIVPSWARSGRRNR